MTGKFKFNDLTTFYHHRSGWKEATIELKKLESPDGILFFDWADKIFKEEIVIKEDWCGIFHNTLTYPDEYPNKYNGRIYQITKLIELPYFKESLTRCKGIITLCDHVANYLKRNLPCISIVNLLHPINDTPDLKKFSIENYRPEVVMIGQWLRKYHSIYELKGGKFKKNIIHLEWFSSDYHELKKYTNKNDVNIINYLNNQLYDDMLSKSIVFLDLYDSAACNVLLECIIRNTPILINPLPATVQYLGAEYPFYYLSLDEASDKLNNSQCIAQAHQYLKNMDKTKFSSREFLSKIENSQWYNQL